jgi:hypothetical protein
MRRSIVLAFAALALSAPAWANWTATGSFKYEDRDWNQAGFTGTLSIRPVRFADVEVIDANKNGGKAILAKGKTDANGSFSIAVTDSSTRTVKVRVYTRTTQTADLFVKVTNLGGSVYAGDSGSVANHGPNTNVNFGTTTARAFSGGEAFNMLDLGIYGADFVKFLTGARPASSRLVTFRWQRDGNIGGSYASGGTVTMRDSGGYDDTVILHEWAHYVMYYYSKSSNPGFSHALADCAQDLRLAFDEGRASFLGAAVARHFGFPNPALYVRTSGASGAGGVLNMYDLEDEAQYACDGDQSEVTVSRSLWDIGDGAATADATPGTDEAWDFLALPDVEVWQVFTGPVKSATNVTHESFWDGWFDATVANGYLTQMKNVFGTLGIEFSPDAFEPNATAATATPLDPIGPALHATFFSDPDGDGKGQVDTDWFRFSASAGSSYTLQTTGLFNGANTKIEVLDTNGSTVLASNDDRATGDPSSWVSWTAPRGGTFYLRVTEVNPYGNYGSYDVGLTQP